MNIEQLREYCLSLPRATEDVKWGDNLCFLIAKKMFCVTRLDGPFAASLKVNEDEFEELSISANIIPAPYLARGKWILIQSSERFSADEWKQYIKASYELIIAKLPKKTLDELKLYF